MNKGVFKNTLRWYNGEMREENLLQKSKTKSIQFGRNKMEYDKHLNGKVCNLTNPFFPISYTFPS